MCILLCASSKAREWLEIPQALAYRQALQLCTLCPNVVASEVQRREPQSLPVASLEFDEAAQRRIMRRSAWVQAYCRYRTHLTQPGNHSAACGASSVSPNEWQKAFDAIAKTWGRLLSLVGLRW
jgi:hypothetical protein